MTNAKLSAVVTVLSDPELGAWYKGQGITPAMFNVDNVDAYATEVGDYNYGGAADSIIAEGEDAGLLLAGVDYDIKH